MYDPDRKRTPDDCGDFCPACGGFLLFAPTNETRPHVSGEGLAYDCPFCGEPLRENEHLFVFFDDPTKEMPPPRKVPGLTVRPHPESNPAGDDNLPWEVVLTEQSRG